MKFKKDFGELKDRKAPGSNQITAEVLKAGGDTMEKTRVSVNYKQNHIQWVTTHFLRKGRGESLKKTIPRVYF